MDNPQVDDILPPVVDDSASDNEEHINGISDEVPPESTGSDINLHSSPSVHSSWVREPSESSLAQKSILSLPDLGLPRLPYLRLDLCGLTHVDLSRNRLQRLPNSFLRSLSNVQLMDLSRNRLLSLPLPFGAHMTQLTYLNLSDNKLEILPITLCKCTQLVYLNCKRNPFAPCTRAVLGSFFIERDCHEAAVNLLYFFQHLWAYLDLPESKFESVTKILEDGVIRGRDEAKAFLGLSKELTFPTGKDPQADIAPKDSRGVHRILTSLAKKNYCGVKADSDSLQALIRHLNPFKEEVEIQEKVELEAEPEPIELVEEKEEPSKFKKIGFGALLVILAGLYAVFLAWPCTAAILLSKDGLQYLVSHPRVSWLIPLGISSKFARLHSGAQRVLLWATSWIPWKLLPIWDYHFPQEVNTIWSLIRTIFGFGWIKSLFLLKQRV